jgi:hypothetical protein
MFITSKHLTETGKEETGKSAKECIDEMVILEAKVLQNEATPIKVMLQEKNNNEAPNEGWYVNIDVIYAGGSQDTMLNYIEELKKDRQFEGIAQ